MIDRRSFLLAGGGALGAAALAGCTPPTTIPPGVFTLGVASGLHSPTEAVLWTARRAGQRTVDDLGGLGAGRLAVVRERRGDRDGRSERTERRLREGAGGRPRP